MFIATALFSWAILKHLRRDLNKIKSSNQISHAIYIINKPEEWDEIYEKVLNDIRHVKVLGLDCEWVQRRPVALLQLSTPTGLCVLVRLFKLGSGIPETLKSLLADKSVLKVGVAILDDSKKLFQDYGLQVNGCVDLRHMLKRVRGVFHCVSKGLRGLASGVLGVDISKNEKIRCGNWEAENYSQAQIEYAATDAAVAVDIFVQIVYAKLNGGMQGGYKKQNHDIIDPNDKSLDKTERTEHKELYQTSDSEDKQECAASLVKDRNETIKIHDERNSASSLCAAEETKTFELNQKGFFKVKAAPDSTAKRYKFCDTFRVQYTNRPNNYEHQHQIFWRSAKSLCQGIVGAPYTYNGEKKGMTLLTKASGKIKESSAYSVRKKPLWDNCRLEAPDGTMLCTCDTRKAQWYLDKELADKIDENPLTVRLRFEPARRPQEEMNFYKQEKQNICVVCGHDKDYIRKFVIPYEYRKYLPFALKDHSSHDVLLLCTLCHRKSCDFDAQLRLHLAQECNAPVESGSAAKMVLDHDLQKIRSAGRALKLNREAIPENRVAQLEEVLHKHFGTDNLTDDLIDQAAEIDARHTSSDYVPHAKRVVRHMISNGGLLAFQARWRQHFVDTMKPQHLPAFWSVDFVPDSWRNNQES
ncbi:exonuclease 3'-5' domain-containing protein 2 [Plakobranchus ocellatus]|uniref:Exonuclease 3'-5' domain-containing protein 2 n=1 Tax=Plakobranchus ocellatus TaxID=259542 RepID=A0AAV4BI00_9GAST|nr:exonuclease 3'-5' domain-containing protein 2 [Plakobranchus ocellatus]